MTGEVVRLGETDSVGLREVEGRGVRSAGFESLSWSEVERAVRVRGIVYEALHHVLLFYIGIFVAFLLVQHEIFFSMPPDPSLYRSVNMYTYLLMGVTFVAVVRATAWLVRRLP